MLLSLSFQCLDLRCQQGAESDDEEGYKRLKRPKGQKGSHSTSSADHSVPVRKFVTDLCQYIPVAEATSPKAIRMPPRAFSASGVVLSGACFFAVF